MNIIDKAIGVFNPKSALQRGLARQQLQALESLNVKNYSKSGGSKTNKVFVDMDIDGRSPEDDISSNLKILRARSRELYMTTELGSGILKKMRTNVIGRGLRCKPNIDADILGITPDEARKIELQILREWKLWSESTNCDAERKHKFVTLQRLAFLSKIMNGDIFFTTPYKNREGVLYDLTIQLIEGDRVTSPLGFDSKITEGIERDVNGEVVAYHIASKTDFSSFFQTKRYKAFGEKTGERLVHHLFDPERVGQVRGVPLLAPVIEAVKQITQYKKAEITRAVVMGVLTAFIVTNRKDGEPSIFEEMESEEVPKVTGTDSLELGHGNIIELSEGEDVKTVSPQVQAGFEVFFNAVATQIGAAIEMPKDVLLNTFNSSYSASRAALLEFWRVCNTEQEYMASNFNQPIYEKFIIEALAKGRLDLPGFFDDPIKKQAYTRCKWIGEVKGHLDPLKEVAASAKRIEIGVSSREIEAGNHGNDFEEVHKQLVIEKNLREKGGLDEKQAVLEHKESK